MSNQPDLLPADLAAGRAMILAERAARQQAEAERSEANAAVSAHEAFILHLKLEIEKLRRTIYGAHSERASKLLEQLEMQLEDAEADATGDELAAEKASHSSLVNAFERRRPARKPFPEHLPLERIVIAGTESCPCCGSMRLSKLGETPQS